MLNDILKLFEWLVFCFVWGLFVDIILFDLEIWIVILCKKVDVECLEILDDILSYIVG